MSEPVDVDAMLEEALDKIDESDRNSGHGNAEPMAAIIQGDSSKEKGNDENIEKSVEKSVNGSAKMETDGSAVDSNEKRKDEHRRHSRSSSRNRSTSREKEKKKRRRTSSRERRKKSKSRSRSRDRRRGSRKRSRSRHRSRSKERSHRSHSRRRSRSRRSRDRKRSHSRSRRGRSRSWSRPRVLDHRDRRFSPMWRRSPPRGPRLPGPERRDVMPFTARRSPPPNAKLNMTSEERDQRTIFILQAIHLLFSFIAKQTRPRDLEEFFSSVGHVRDVRIITDSKTRRSKGICYVEFWEIESVNLALALNGQKLLGAPLVIQQTLAERNRAANNTVGGSLGFGPTNTTGPLKLYVGNLHPSITEDMLGRIFDPFGKIDHLEVATDLSGVSKGYAYVTFRHADDGKRAMEQLNGFELANRSMKVGTVEKDETVPIGPQRTLDTDEADRRGIDLGTSGRIHLMAKLAEGSGLELPKSAKEMLALNQNPMDATPAAIPPIATQCFVLSNMFDPKSEQEETWAEEVRDDVIEECAKNGGILHIYVDKESPNGNVYVKCPNVTAAFNSVNSLHGRWFSGKVITANYVPLASYSQLFPASVSAHRPILSGMKVTSSGVAV
uniref:RNA-binding protein 39 n=1 Tax=Syphacia muris TaxID=451379 RepID=A0A158R3S7_9BILA